MPHCTQNVTNALRLLSWRPELHDAESGELKFIAWISGLRNKLPGGFPAARRLSQLTVCAAERVTGSPLVAASRVTASVFGSSATAELMRLRVANSIVFFLNRR